MSAKPAPVNPYVNTNSRPKLDGNPFANVNSGSRAAMPSQVGYSLGGMGNSQQQQPQNDDLFGNTGPRPVQRIKR